MSLTTPRDVAAAIGENQNEPQGPVRIARAEQLVEAAQQTGDRPLLIRALQHLINAYERGGQRGRLLVPFTQVLKLWDTARNQYDDFDDAAVHCLFWHCKWATEAMIYDPEVPLPTILDWLHHMGRRYAERGYKQREVYAGRVHLEQFIGDLGAARKALDRRLANAHDRVSCKACDHGFDGDWHECNGRDEQALAAWRPVLDGEPLALWHREQDSELTCAEQTHRVLATSLLPLVRVGRVGQARANHQRGYLLVRGQPHMRALVGLHLEFAALTGGEARALEILAEHNAWLAPAGELAGERLAFLGAVAVLLRRLSALGREELPVATPGGPAPAAELGRRVEEELAAIAAAFDARNGSTAVTDRVAARISREPFASEAQFRPQETVPAGPDPTAAAAAGPSVLSTEVLSVEVPSIEVLSIEDRIAAADLCRERGEFAEAEEHARAGLREGVQSIDPELAGRLALLVAEAVWEQGGRDDAVVDFALQAADRLRERSPGAAAHAGAMVGYGLQRQGRGRAAEAVAALEGVLPDLERYADEFEIVRARHCLYQALIDLGRYEEAARVVQRAAAIASGWPDQRRHASLSSEAGRALEAASEHAESLRAYERAAALWLEVGEPVEHIRATRAGAWVRWCQAAPDWSGALAQLRAARAVSAGDPALAAEHRATSEQIMQLVGYLAQARGGPDEALEQGLVEADAAAAGFADRGDHSRAAQTWLVAALLEHKAGRTAAARARLVAVRTAALARGQAKLALRCDRFLAKLGSSVDS